MAITTKTGDSGMTSLYFGGRVSKDDSRVEAYGTLDELASFLGMAKSLVRDKRLKAALESIQVDLFIIGAEIATKPKYLKRLGKRIDESCVKRLERSIKRLEDRKFYEGCCFYLAGGNFISSVFDVSRTVARRAERLVVRLKNKGMLRNHEISIYLNRLSDLLYLFARFHERRHKAL